MPAKRVVKTTNKLPTDAISTDFGARLANARLKRGLSQDEVGAMASLRGAVVGRYERGEAKPSVEIAARLAQALGVSLDFLTGLTDTALDNTITNRVLAIQELKDQDQQHVYALLDAFISRKRLELVL